MKTTIKTIGLAAIATLALVGCGSSGGGGDDTPQVEYHPYDAPAISESQKAQFLNAVNGVRSIGRSCGTLGHFEAVPALTWSDALYKSSYEHSEDMASANITGHNGSGTASDWTSQILTLGRGSYANERIVNNGGGSLNGENVFWGKGSSSYTSLSAAIQWWLGSDGHCANMMSSNWTKFGMANVNSSSSAWDANWTQNFSN